jgi:hypothetical protein
VLATAQATAVEPDTAPEIVENLVADVLPEVIPAPVQPRAEHATVVHRIRIPERSGDAVAESPAVAPRVKTPKPPKVKLPKPPKGKTPKVKLPKPPKLKTRKVREQKPAQNATPAPVVPAHVAAAPVKQAPTANGSKSSRFALRPNETIEREVRGRSRLLPATLIVTTYRVALVRLGRTRWIPLEEVRSAAPAGRGLTIEASIEQFRFRAKAADLDDAVNALQASLREARRSNSRRHDAAITQEWCDRCEIWDSHTGRIRLWLNRHPVLIVALVAALVGLIAVYSAPH